MSQNTPFKTCPGCKASWPSRDDFLNDQKLILGSYRPDFSALENGQFLFSHVDDACGATLGVHTRTFLDLYRGERFSGRKPRGPACPGHCADASDFSRCDAECESRIVREVMQLMRKRTAA